MKKGELKRIQIIRQQRLCVMQPCGIAETLNREKIMGTLKINKVFKKSLG